MISTSLESGFQSSFSRTYSSRDFSKGKTHFSPKSMLLQHPRTTFLMKDDERTGVDMTTRFRKTLYFCANFSVKNDQKFGYRATFDG